MYFGYCEAYQHGHYFQPIISQTLGIAQDFGGAIIISKYKEGLTLFSQSLFLINGFSKPDAMVLS